MITQWIIIKWGFERRKRRLKRPILRWREQKKSESKSVYVGGYFHWSCFFVLFYAVQAPQTIVKKARKIVGSIISRCSGKWARTLLRAGSKTGPGRRRKSSLGRPSSGLRKKPTFRDATTGKPVVASRNVGYSLRLALQELDCKTETAV